MSLAGCLSGASLAYRKNTTRWVRQCATPNIYSLRSFSGNSQVQRDANPARPVPSAGQRSSDHTRSVTFTGPSSGPRQCPARKIRLRNDRPGPYACHAQCGRTM